MTLVVGDAERDFLATMRERYRRVHREEREYDAIVYGARFLPDPTVLRLIARMCARRTGDEAAVPTEEAPRAALAEALAPMQWPDPAPLAAAARHLPGWTTLHVTTLLHALIPDYAVWGPEESAALARLGIQVPYEDRPEEAAPAYRAFLEAVHALREAAHYHQVPESHHFLTRVVQAALLDLGREPAPAGPRRLSRAPPSRPA